MGTYNMAVLPLHQLMFLHDTYARRAMGWTTEGLEFESK
jgi:hypothetical protein